MSIPKISGQQARELLDGTTPGPWEWRERRGGDTAAPDRMTLGTEFQDALKTFDGEDYLSGVNGSIEDLNLAATAPELAETVVWLYDRIREIHNDQRCWADAYRAPIEWDPHSTDPARLARAEAHDDCADMLATLLDDEEARP